MKQAAVALLLLGVLVFLSSMVGILWSWVDPLPTTRPRHVPRVIH